MGRETRASRHKKKTYGLIQDEIISKMSKVEIRMRYPGEGLGGAIFAIGTEEAQDGTIRG